MTRRIYMNEDDAHYYSCHPAEDMSVEGLERLVDFYAEETQVAAVLYCACLQKALFDSTTMEPLYEGYDPDGGPDQPFLQLLDPALREIIPGDHARNWVHNLWLMNRGKGIDHLKVWLDRTRHHGIEGWLTVRMNDAHGLQEYEARVNGESTYDGWALLCPSTMWKENPHLRRAPYRGERSWEGAYDYAHAEVRQQYLDLIGELLTRYDMDGIELDWLRWGMNFKPGHEQQGRAILSDFVHQVRKLADASAARMGHPVQIGVRVPSEIQAGWALGYDAPRWAREGWVDQIVLSSMSGDAHFNYPIEEWRLIVGEDIRLITHCSDHGTPYPDYGKPVGHEEVFYGVAATALNRGADGVYLFNECYTESTNSSYLKRLLQRLGDLDTLIDLPRRHLLTHPNCRPAGEAPRTLLPIDLRPRVQGSDFGRMEHNITLRIQTGPAAGATYAVLQLGFSPDTPTIDPGSLDVRLNTHPVSPATDRPPSTPEANRIEWAADYSESIGHFIAYQLPTQLLHDDSNTIEFIPPDTEGQLVWAEIRLSP